MCLLLPAVAILCASLRGAEAGGQDSANTTRNAIFQKPFRQSTKHRFYQLVGGNEKLWGKPVRA